MQWDGFLKLTENKPPANNPKLKSQDRIKAADKLLEKHFTAKQFKLRTRRNSTYSKIFSHEQAIQNKNINPMPILEPLVLKSSQMSTRTRIRLPLGNLLKCYNVNTPQKNEQMSKQPKVQEIRVQSARKLIIQPKVLRSRVFSSQSKRRIFSADQRQKQQVPLIFTFGKDQLKEI